MAEAYRVLEQDVVDSHAFAQEEVERYTYRMPGQANSYFYGYTRLIELREDTEKAVGTKIQPEAIPRLHFGAGPVPPDLMRKATMEDFIPALKKNQRP